MQEHHRNEPFTWQAQQDESSASSDTIKKHTFLATLAPSYYTPGFYKLPVDTVVLCAGVARAVSAFFSSPLFP